MTTEKKSSQTKIMKKKLQTDKQNLFLLTQALLDLEADEVRGSFSSGSHRIVALELRVNLGGRLFRSRMKDPVPKFMKLSHAEIELLHFATRISQNIEEADRDRMLRVLNPLIT